MDERMPHAAYFQYSLSDLHGLSAISFLGYLQKKNPFSSWVICNFILLSFGSNYGLKAMMILPKSNEFI
jgi:hypothetical protein